MAKPEAYDNIAKALKAKIKMGRRVNKDFRRFSFKEIDGALEKAGKGTSAKERQNLEDALLIQGVRAYPPMSPGKGYCLLFHHDTAVAKLVDAVTKPGEDNDKKLGKLANAAKSEKKVNLKGLLD